MSKFKVVDENFKEPPKPPSDSEPPIDVISVQIVENGWIVRTTNCIGYTDIKVFTFNEGFEMLSEISRPLGFKVFDEIE